MASSAKDWEDLKLTRDEVETMTKAFKDDAFKKMFFEYCEEIQNPENRRIYEQELTQLERERGVDVTFINPEPGFVVKTSVDGKTKGFLNIARSDKVDKPKSIPQLDQNTGKRGLMWSIPLAQAPPRKDFDKKGSLCTVFDVVFHPDAIRMADTNVGFRKHLVETACDAVEREHKVKLDRSNLKFPKMSFKGIAQPTVIRKMSKEQPELQEPSPIDNLMPPLPQESKPKVFTSKASKPRDEFATPKYVIKHRRDVDLSEMTYELDAKLNVTVPKELVVEISLPMLNSTSECTLDVTDRKLYLVSMQPAKYKLNIDLPYPVNDKNGSAKFDKAARKLIVTLPVCCEKERTLKDLYREDSGVESDVRDDSGNVSPTLDSPKIVVLPSPRPEPQTPLGENPLPSVVNQPFLDSNVEYNFPTYFDCNTLDENLAFTLHVKNVQPDSIEHIKTDNSVHIKFATLGSGFYPTYYAFFVQLPSASSACIRSVDIEPWDNNLILSLALQNYIDLKSYLAGSDPEQVTDYPITEEFQSSPNKFNLLHENGDLEVSVKPLPDAKQIEIEIRSSQESLSRESKKSGGQPSSISKKHKKKNKKRRSYSESSCDELKTLQAEAAAAATSRNNEPNENDVFLDAKKPASDRKIRSLSESRSNDSIVSSSQKGILKRHSRYGRSISESYASSVDEHSSYSCSMEFGAAMESFDDIPEEGDCTALSESCKKTVRFSDVIKKQLFRMDSSILGQRKKNQKRKTQKLRARQRRNSEGDSADYEHEDKSPGSDQIARKNSRLQAKHDSGVDLSVERNPRRVSQNLEDSDEQSDQELSKSALIFDLEM